MYNIQWTHAASDELDKLESSIATRISKKIDGLKDNPFSSDIKRLKEFGTLRLRVGDYRVIFDVQGDKIIILKVGHRRNVYDRLTK
jgi:mRNA interferase RelE/StbE